MDRATKRFQKSGIFKTALLVSAALLGLLAFGAGPARAAEATPVYACDAAGQNPGNTIDKNTVTDLFVADDVTTIGNNAFENCGNLKNAIVPAKVTEIGDYAFKNSGLAGIELTEGLIKIGGSAFEGCKELKTVEMPATVTEFGTRAYYGESYTRTFVDSGLTCIDLSKTQLRTIGKGTFENCKALETIAFPDTVTEIENAAFKGSGLTKVELPDGLTVIKDSVFGKCTALQTITVPATLKEIGSYAFR